MIKRSCRHRGFIMCSLILIVCCSSFQVLADDIPSKTQTKNVLCPNADLWRAHLVDQICWSCLLPIHIMGIGTGGDTPPGANKKPFCSCTVGDEIKSTEVGVSIGFWEPHRLVEGISMELKFLKEEISKDLKRLNLS